MHSSANEKEVFHGNWHSAYSLVEWWTFTEYLSSVMIKLKGKNRKVFNFNSQVNYIALKSSDLVDKSTTNLKAFVVSDFFNTLSVECMSAYFEQQ